MLLRELEEVIKVINSCIYVFEAGESFRKEYANCLKVVNDIVLKEYKVESMRHLPLDTILSAGSEKITQDLKEWFLKNCHSLKE